MHHRMQSHCCATDQCNKNVLMIGLDVVMIRSSHVDEDTLSMKKKFISSAKSVQKENKRISC